MRTGSLNISRGQGSGSAAGPRLSIVARETVPVAPEVSPAYRPIHDRLSALERLARLREQGALTEAEFAAEKAAILVDPNELVLNEPLLPAEPTRPPSLIGRLFGWKVIPIGLIAGLALSYASQPRETLRFFADAVSLFGA